MIEQTEGNRVYFEREKGDSNSYFDDGKGDLYFSQENDGVEIGIETESQEK